MFQKIVKTKIRSSEKSSPSSFKTSGWKINALSKMSIILIFSTRHSLNYHRIKKGFIIIIFSNTSITYFFQFFPKNGEEIVRNHFCHLYIFKQFDYFIIAQEICIKVKILLASNTLIFIPMLYFHCHSFLLCPLLMILAIFWHRYIFFWYILEYVLIFSWCTFIFLSTYV